jgi:hypothetical protein
MYINPAVVTMFIAMLMAFIAVGGVLWKLAGTIGDVKRDVAVMTERLDGHIKACGPQKSHS